MPADKLSHLRDSARQCRESAAQTVNPIMAQQLFKLAGDIEQLVADMERRAAQNVVVRHPLSLGLELDTGRPA